MTPFAAKAAINTPHQWIGVRSSKLGQVGSNPTGGTYRRR